jgi:flagellar hook assembly protein FlgD
LAAPGQVSLLLYDVRGRSVRTLVEEQQSAGEHEVMVDGAGLPSGVYWYRLEANNERLERRFTLIR